MRKAYTNVKVVTENEVFYGISLGFDFTAEHEWGTKEMQERLGIDASKLGIEGRRVTNPVKIKLLHSADGVWTMLTTKAEKTVLFEDSIPYDITPLSRYDEEPDALVTAWDGRNFCILTKSPEIKAHLQTLFDAAQKNDMVLAHVRNMAAFEGTSLCVLVGSALDAETVDSMYRADKSAIDLVAYEKEIGITDLKAIAKKNGYKGEHYFMACSPRWIDYDDPVAREERKAEMGTEYDIMFWVNYSDDDDNFGWYKAEEIKEWLSTPGLKLKQIRDAKEVKI